MGWLEGNLRIISGVTTNQRKTIDISQLFELNFWSCWYSAEFNELGEYVSNLLQVVQITIWIKEIYEKHAQK